MDHLRFYREQNPAHAGMNLRIYLVERPDIAKPRTRGDEPKARLDGMQKFDKTPHTRG